MLSMLDVMLLIHQWFISYPEKVTEMYMVYKTGNGETKLLPVFTWLKRNQN